MESSRLRRPRRRKSADAERVAARDSSDRTLALTLGELDELVAATGERHPDRVEEWRWYLDYLRQSAGADGAIPREYRLLVRLVFGELPQVASALA